MNWSWSWREWFWSLFKVKTLITLSLVATLIWGYVTGAIQTDLFLPFVTMVVTNLFRKDANE